VITEESGWVKTGIEKKNREKRWLEVAQGQLPPPLGWFFGTRKRTKTNTIKELGI